MIRSHTPPEKEAAFRAGLLEALNVGAAVLQAGGSAEDAVEQSIVSLEECPHFNAGKGSVRTGDGRVELDASFMRGRDRRAGAVAGLTVVRNPIRLARAVLEHTPYVFLMGRGAELLASLFDHELVPQEFFYTEERWQQLVEAQELEAQYFAQLKKESVASEAEDVTNVASTGTPSTQAPDAETATAGVDQAQAGPTPKKLEEPDLPEAKLHKIGTVGAVALDVAGQLAAGTSTGGMCNKRFGRVGDTPLVGSGVFAWDNTCAVSCTGHGEYFIRTVLAHDVSIRMELLNESVWLAAEKAIFERLQSLGGTGGLIALDRLGRLAMPYNTEGMHRAYLRRDGTRVVQIWTD